MLILIYLRFSMMKEPSNIKIYRGLLKKRKNLPNKQWKDNKITNMQQQ